MPQLLKSMTNSRRSRKLLHIIFKEKNPLDAFMNHQIRVKFSSYEWSIWKLLLHSLRLDISATVLRLSLTLSSVSIICMVAKDISFKILVFLDSKQNSLTIPDLDFPAPFPDQWKPLVILPLGPQECCVWDYEHDTDLNSTMVTPMKLFCVFLNSFAIFPTWSAVKEEEISQGL